MRSRQASRQRRLAAACEALEGRLLLSDQPARAPGLLSLSSSFDATNYDQNLASVGDPAVPASPSAAAGPNQLVTTVNRSIEWFGKSGARQNSQTLADFFAPLNAAASISSAKTLYDPLTNRFLVLALDETAAAPQQSRILLAASDDADPNGAWYFQAIDATNTAGTSAAIENPAIATDANALYITADLFSPDDGAFQGSRLWIVGKSALYAGIPATCKVYDPAAAAGVARLASMQPAQVFGAAPTGLGTFLLSSGFSGPAGDDYLSVIRVDDPLGSPTFTNTFISLGDIDASGDLPDAPQPDSATLIDSGDKRITSAVWRDGNLYAANTINPVSGFDAGQATAHWYRIATPFSGVLSLADQGDIGGEDIGYGTFTYNPSLAVDAAGDIAVGFSASGPSTYAGAYFTGRRHNDVPCTTLPAATLRAGADSYVRTLAGDESVWGRSSGTVLDPADGRTFWTFNAYAMSRGSEINGEDGRWATALGGFRVADAYSTGDISGSIYYDCNSNGVRGAGEVGLGGRTLYLDQNYNGTFDVSTTEQASADVPLAIDDQDTITSSITFSGHYGAVSNIELTLDIAHPWDSDLKACLISPTGTRILLFNRVGATGNDFTSTTLTDRAAISVDDGTAPFSAQYRPAEPLSTFNGEDANGTWRLEISDLAAGDVGTLNAWSMKLTTSELSTTTDDAGRYQFSELMPGSYRVAEVLPDGWTMTTGGFSDVDVAPGQLAAGTDFGNYAAPTSISGLVYNDANANGTLNNLEGSLANWQVYLDSNANAQFDFLTRSYDAMGLPAQMVVGSALRSTLTVTGTPGVIQNLILTFNLAHAHTNDLSVALISPDGLRISLFDQAGDGGADFTNTVFDDSATNFITQGSAPFTGVFRPTQPLSTFNGLSANGVWTLEVVDQAASGAVDLLGWSLNLSSSEPVVPSNELGEYRFDSLPASTYLVREVTRTGWLQTQPTSSYYRAAVSPGASFITADFGNAQLAQIHGTVFNDINSNGSREPGETGLGGWTVFIDQNNNGIRDVAGTSHVQSTDVPLAIPDQATATSSLLVSALAGPLNSLSIHLKITHPWVEDLQAYLISPSGRRVLLFRAAGGGGANFNDTTLADDASASITDAYAPFGGNYRPQEALAGFIGENPNGTWRLELTDLAADDVGTIVSWSLDINSGQSEPATLTADDGSYPFMGLLPGLYHVRLAPQAGWQQTSPAVYDLNLASQQSSDGVDFATSRLPGEIDGSLFNDINSNGIRDPGEPGLAGWQVYIDANMNGMLDLGEPSVLTGPDGRYAFAAVQPGTYVVAAVPRQGWVQTYPPATTSGEGGVHTIGSTDPSVPYGAASDDNSEFMIGDVWVNVVLMESNGGIDASTEDWTTDQIANVEREIREGLDWWQRLFDSQTPHPSAHLDFHLDFTYAEDPAPTAYEPIRRSSSDESLWIDDFLTDIGYNPSAGYLSELARWNDAQRRAHDTQWAYTIFVVNSAADSDGEFLDNYFAYAYFGGPMLVMTYDNDGWGIDNMSQIVAHESAHIFYALDEYTGASTYNEHSGYYNIQNLNADDGNPRPYERVPSLMAEPALQDAAYLQNISSPTSLQMLGWRDLDGDGIFDVLDVPLTLSGSGFFNPLTRRYEFTGASSVATLPNLNPWGNGHGITLNRVAHVQYRLDGGPWIDGNAYGSYTASIAQNVPIVTTGAHRIEFRTICDETGVTSPIWSDTFNALFGVQIVTVAAGQVRSDVNFGNRPQTVSVIDGTEGNDDYYLQLNGDGTALEIYAGTGPTGSPAYVIPLGSIPSLTFNLFGGSDSITVASDTTSLGLLKILATGDVDLHFIGGTSTLDASGSTGDVSISASGDAVVNLLESQRLSSLSIGDSARVSLLADDSHILRVNGLSIDDDGTLDLCDNDLIVQAPDTATRDAWLATIASLIKQARNTWPGLWNGAGITSSTAKADSSKLTGVAVSANADNKGNALYPYDPADLARKPGWQNQPVDTNSILVKYTFNGDADLNGTTDGADYFLIDMGYMSKYSTKPLTGYYNGDFDYNGLVDGADYFLIDMAYLGKRSHNPPAPLAASAAPSLFSRMPIERSSVLAKATTRKFSTRSHHHARHAAARRI